MISLSTSLVENILNDFESEIKSHWDISESLMKDYLVTLGNGQESDYLNLLLSYGSEIIIANPNRLKQFKSSLDQVISPKDMNGIKFRAFREKLIEIMGYEKLRSAFLPNFFSRVGIKSCVYCNALLTVVVERKLSPKKSKVYQAKFQADHYLSKKEYPCFSISVFNLYPVCANCNLSKGIKKVSFNLYHDSLNNISPFQFSLHEGSQSKYLLSRNLDDIKIDFKEPVPDKGINKFEDVFGIEAIYSSQRDVASELILKLEAYPDSYKIILSNSLPKIFRDTSLLNRLIIGNYANEVDMHKRPLAKFTMDIAIQIGLIVRD